MADCKGQIISLVPPAQRTRWHCSVCGKSLSSKRSYDEHMNIHNDARPFACEHCDYAAGLRFCVVSRICRNIRCRFPQDGVRGHICNIKHVPVIPGNGANGVFEIILDLSHTPHIP
ncbi:zinc finger, C2H2 type [Cooperia oncophora]